MALKRVMIVEDDRALLELLVDYFEHQGVEVIAAERALEAIEKLTEGPRPDVILTDLRMPKVSGEEFVARLRADARWADIPIALMSGDAGRLAVVDGEALPALAKPFTIDELNDVLARYGQHIEGAAP